MNPDFLDRMAENLGWALTYRQAKLEGRCVRCGLDVTPDEEHAISGLCDRCFDEITKPLEGDEE